MLYATQERAYDVLTSGIDWITCTAKNGAPSLALERVAMAHVEQQRCQGVNPLPQVWQGFTGIKLDGMFFGNREHDKLLCLSGQLANEIGLDAVAVSTNVSRIDLQVTFITNGELLNLAWDTWSSYRKVAKGTGRPRAFKLIVGHPEGQTFYLNKRTSDNFGRIYDKGAETELAPAGLVWRYEVEFKRRVAKQIAAGLPPREQLGAYVSDRVRSWWTARDIETPWAKLTSLACNNDSLRAYSADVLTWYQNSLSISIARSIKQFGLNQVLNSLSLQNLVVPKGEKSHGSF